MFDKAYTMKKSWKFKRVEKRVEKRLDLPFYPKHYFWIIYTHYDEIMTKHIRWNHDKPFTKKFWQSHLRRSFDKTCTMKSWQNMYDEVLTKHLRWSHDKTCTMKFWQNIYEEVLTKHIRRSFDKAYTMKSSMLENMLEKVLDLTF